MHIKVLKIIFLGILIGNSAEPRQPLLKKINSKRINRKHQNIKSQVKLESIYQQWLRYILLDHHLILLFDVVRGVNKEDASALARSFRLYNKYLFWFVLKTLFKFAPVSRNEKRSWKKVIFLREFLSHLLQVSGQVILPTQLIHSWKVISFLIRFHPGNTIGTNSVISPENIPIFILLHNFTRLNQ